MKKYFLLGLIVAIAPNICFGGGARYTQLVREKQRKMEELEKCMGSTKGLKIAGISTLGLSAVGVAGNIAEAQKLQEYDDTIAKKNKDIEAKEKAIADEKEKIAKKQQEKSNPTPAPINENQQQCINRVNGEFTGGIPSKYQDSLKKELDNLLEEVVDEDGDMIWYGHKVTCKKDTKFKNCDGVNDLLQGVYKDVLKAAVTDKECGTHLFNKIEEPMFLDGTDVAVDTFTENCKNSGGISTDPGTCQCLYGTANFMGQCSSLSTNPVNNKNLSGTAAAVQVAKLDQMKVDEDTLATMQRIVDSANFDFAETEEEVEPTTEMIKYQEQIVACVFSGGSWVDSKCECESGYTVGADGICVIISGAD